MLAILNEETHEYVPKGRLCDHLAGAQEAHREHRVSEETVQRLSLLLLHKTPPNYLFHFVKPYYGESSKFDSEYDGFFVI